jgi:group I intron endonuclease
MADTKVPGIYAIRNLINGKCYVGSAVRIARRWEVHRSGLKTGKHRCKPLQRAYDKYGKEAFSYEILEVVDVLTDLIPREQYWLDRLESHCDKGGYNVCPVAESRLGMKMPQSAKDAIGAKSRGRSPSSETRAKIGAAHKGKTISADQRAAYSALMKGRKQSPEHVARRAASTRGRKISDEQKKAISKVHSGKVISQSNKDAVGRAAKMRWAAFRAAGSRMSPLAIANIVAAAKLREEAKRQRRLEGQLSLFDER